MKGDSWLRLEFAILLAAMLFGMVQLAGYVWRSFAAWF